jgi:hypothetical protein
MKHCIFLISSQQLGWSLAEILNFDLHFNKIEISYFKSSLDFYFKFRAAKMGCEI